MVVTDAQNEQGEKLSVSYEVPQETIVFAQPDDKMIQPRQHNEDKAQPLEHPQTESTTLTTVKDDELEPDTTITMYVLIVDVTFFDHRNRVTFFHITNFQSNLFLI